MFNIKETDARYHLYGDIWGNSEFHCYFDDYAELIKEAYSRYEDGYHVHYHDKVTGETHFVGRNGS